MLKFYLCNYDPDDEPDVDETDVDYSEINSDSPFVILG